MDGNSLSHNGRFFRRLSIIVLETVLIQIKRKGKGLHYMLKKTVLAFKVKIIVPKIVRQELQFDKVGLKTPSPNNQGLNFLLHVPVQASFETLSQSKSGENTRKTGGNTRETGENSRGKVLSTGHSLFFAGPFVQEWRSRNAEQ